MNLNECFKVRASLTCPRCKGEKGDGLLLCWRCHHAQKRQFDGDYSAKTIRTFEQTELLLREARHA